MNATDLNLLKKTIELSQRAREKGNHPFGSLLADKNGNVLVTAENTVVTARDITGHAETNLVREAARKFTRAELSETTLYTSCEPCPMCGGAIFWANIGRVVFALRAEKLYEITDAKTGRFFFSFADIFARSDKAIAVEGGVLESEAAAVHEDFRY